MTPTMFGINWSLWDQYIHVEDNKSRLGKILPKKTASFKMTICLAAYLQINKELMTTITLNLALADKFRFRVTGKEIQAVSVVNGLVAAGVVIPDCRGTIISSQYKTAFRKACRSHEKSKGRSKASIKAAEDKINFAMMAKLSWAPGMYNFAQEGEFKKIEWEKKQITILMVDGDSLEPLMTCKKEFKQEARNIAGRHLNVVAPLGTSATPRHKRGFGG